MNKITMAYLQHAAKLLTTSTEEGGGGLSGGKSVELTTAYAYDFGVNVKYSRYPNDAPNKRSMLLENLSAFAPKQQYQIVRELCDRVDPLGERPEIVKLKTKLLIEFAEFADADQLTDVHRTLLVETKHWLADYPESQKLFNEAIQKHDQGVFRRNTLDDLRLALELLLRSLFCNAKSLENQMQAVGSFVRGKGGSSELANMFQKLVEYFSKYQNSYVKHDDAVIVAEVEFVFELTSSFMKHFIRLSKPNH
ncbi:hypothetical protein MCEMSEM18_01413 [Comamonadaceae bacterium]